MRIGDVHILHLLKFESGFSGSVFKLTMTFYIQRVLKGIDILCIIFSSRSQQSIQMTV